MGVDRAPDVPIEMLMEVKDYDTAERNLVEGRGFKMMPEGECLTHASADTCQKCGPPVKTEEGDWYCWSIFLRGYWKPDQTDLPWQWPGHTVNCGRYEIPPWPLEEEDTT